MKPELISFKLCPFVQRSVIVLLEKNAPYDITYIDLQNPPEWFKSVSPMGKVPVLKVGDTVLFESAVIMEYLDEVNPPSLHPADPLRKAHNRAWVEYASGMLFTQFQMIHAKEKSAFEEKRQELRHQLERVENEVQGPYFNGDDFAMADAGFAPLFTRLALLDRWLALELQKGLPKVNAWREALVERRSVRESVVEEFEDLFGKMVRSSGGYAAELVKP
jgi:glutathione S-transferase